jgi:hypothetical protein
MTHILPPRLECIAVSTDNANLCVVGKPNSEVFCNCHKATGCLASILGGNYHICLVPQLLQRCCCMQKIPLPATNGKLIWCIHCGCALTTRSSVIHPVHVDRGLSRKLTSSWGVDACEEQEHTKYSTAVRQPRTGARLCFSDMVLKMQGGICHDVLCRAALTSPHAGAGVCMILSYIGHNCQSYGLNDHIMLLFQRVKLMSASPRA